MEDPDTEQSSYAVGAFRDGESPKAEYITLGSWTVQEFYVAFTQKCQQCGMLIHVTAPHYMLHGSIKLECSGDRHLVSIVK